MNINGKISIPIENEEKDMERAVNFADFEVAKFTEKQRINFTEAALIRTFLPKYNKEYKDTFPNPAHKSYSECYDLDLNAIIVETDTSHVRRWLYSEGKKRKPECEVGSMYWQHGIFYFSNAEDRFKVFNHEYL